MKYTLVFSGGGIKGLTFIGVIKALEKNNIIENTTKIVGSSIGALISTMIVLGYNSSDMFELVQKIKIPSLKDIQFSQFISKYGIDTGDKFSKLFRYIISQKIQKPNITFKELYEINRINLILTGTCIEKQCTEYFSYEKTPTMPLWLAIRISTSMPFYFQPIKFNNFTYIDGALLDPVPVSQTNIDENIIAFKLHGMCDICFENNIKNFEMYAFSVLMCIINNTLMFNVSNTKNRKIIDIKSDIGSLDINLDKSMYVKLIRLGYDQTMEKIELVIKELTKNNGDTNNDKDGDTYNDNDGDTNNDKDGDTNNDNDGDTNNDKDGDTNNDKDGDTNNDKDGDTNNDNDGDTNNDNNGDTNNDNDGDTNNDNDGDTNNDNNI